MQEFNNRKENCRRSEKAEHREGCKQKRLRCCGRVFNEQEAAISGTTDRVNHLKGQGKGRGQQQLHNTSNGQGRGMGNGQGRRRTGQGRGMGNMPQQA